MEEISGGVVGSLAWLDSGVGFCLVDSAFGLESAISARVLQLHCLLYTSDAADD